MRYTRTLQMYVTAADALPTVRPSPTVARHLALQALVETDGFEISSFERLLSILANKSSDQLQVTARNRLYAECNDL